MALLKIRYCISSVLSCILNYKKNENMNFFCLKTIVQYSVIQSANSTLENTHVTYVYMYILIKRNKYRKCFIILKIIEIHTLITDIIWYLIQYIICTFVHTYLLCTCILYYEIILWIFFCFSANYFHSYLRIFACQFKLKNVAVYLFVNCLQILILNRKWR